jgi:hypothetical protein
MVPLLLCRLIIVIFGPVSYHLILVDGYRHLSLKHTCRCSKLLNFLVLSPVSGLAMMCSGIRSRYTAMIISTGMRQQRLDQLYPGEVV